MNKFIKVLVVVGNRPQFIKHASVSKELGKVFTQILVHTGQHYDYNLSQSFFNELKIPEPNFNLEVGSGTHCWQISKIMIKLEKIILEEKPTFLIVYGDTNSTVAGAIVSAKNNIPLVHIEAGLREFNRKIPEEINKLITDIITNYYFCPTKVAVDNLYKMGINENVYNVGDVGIDLISENWNKIKKNDKILKKFNLKKRKYYFVTCHRASNTDNISNLIEIISSFKYINSNIIFSIHPRTREIIDRNDLNRLLKLDNLKIVSPLGFFDTQTLIKYAKMVLTDSGGIIKEAYFYKIPIIIIDTQTEWLETVQEGWSCIAGPNKNKILEKIKNFKNPSIHTNFLGNGKASKKIKDILKHEFC